MRTKLGYKLHMRSDKTLAKYYIAFLIYVFELPTNILILILHCSLLPMVGWLCKV